jgi:prepilin-type N-terminal cleavage/methylation domain-containing protein
MKLQKMSPLNDRKIARFRPICSNKIGRQSGFTMTELVIVIALLSIIGSLTLISSVDFYRRYIFHYETALLVGLLERARSQSLANINQSPHGLCRPNDSYILFSGRDCPPSPPPDEAVVVDIPGSSAVFTIPANWQVVFEALDARVLNPATIVVKEKDGQREAVISVNREGGIQY